MGKPLKLSGMESTQGKKTVRISNYESTKAERGEQEKCPTRTRADRPLQGDVGRDGGDLLSWVELKGGPKKQEFKKMVVYLQKQKPNLTELKNPTNGDRIARQEQEQEQEKKTGRDIRNDKQTNQQTERERQDFNT